jgi:membrane protease YdiL (CAAX protease family)
MALLDDWNDVKAKEAVDPKTLGRQWYEIPARNVNVTAPYNFKLVEPETDGVIFLTFVLFLPLIASIICYTVFKEVNTDTLTLIVNGIALACAVVGFVLTFVRTHEKTFNDGLAFAYFFVIIPYLAIIVGSLILSTLSKDLDQDTLNVYSSFIAMACQTTSEITLIIWFLVKSDNTAQTLKQTFKENWKMLMIVFVCAAIVLFILSNLIFGMAYDKIFHLGESNNQGALTTLIDNPNTAIRISYIILLFISSILVAPLCEELCTRQSFFSNNGNKWLALVMCSIYFGYIHCGQTGDFIHMPSYIAAGFVLSMTFIVTRGNVTYTWMTHCVTNLVSFILIVA